MVDVFEQVEEELRSDRYKRLARTWLPVVGGILLVALIAALAFWGWDSMQTSRAAKASVAYERGLESMGANNPVGADAAFAQAAKDGNGAYKALALMQRAGIALTAGRDAEALTYLDDAAKATRDPLISDAAALKAAWIAMDTATLEDLQTRLKPLVDAKRPFSAFALQAQAMAMLQHGKPAEAREILVVLKNGLDTPQQVSQQAELAINTIDAGGAANLRSLVDKMTPAMPVAPRPAPGGPAGPPAQPAAPARP